MAIEKFTGEFVNNTKGFTTLLTKVVQSITEFDVLGLYVYLCSLPETWQPNAKHLMKHTGYSKDKIYRLLNRLEELGLMTAQEIRDKGRFSIYRYTVHLDFQILPCPENQDTGISPCPEKPDTEKPDTENQDAYKIKRVENKDNKNIYIPDFEKSGTESKNNDLEKPEKTKPARSTKTDYKKDSRFMRFYNAYPKKVDPHDAYKAFKSIIGNDDELLEKVLADIEARKESHSQWQDRRFIKYPAVYLRKGEYESEIINDRLEAEQKRQKEKAIKDAENKAREEAQERLTKERQEAERQNNLNKQADAVSYRKTVKEIPKGLESLKHSIRKWG